MYLLSETACAVGFGSRLPLDYDRVRLGSKCDELLDYQRGIVQVRFNCWMTPKWPDPFDVCVFAPVDWRV